MWYDASYFQGSLKGLSFSVSCLFGTSLRGFFFFFFTDPNTKTISSLTPTLLWQPTLSSKMSDILLQDALFNSKHNTQGLACGEVHLSLSWSAVVILDAITFLSLKSSARMTRYRWHKSSNVGSTLSLEPHTLFTKDVMSWPEWQVAFHPTGKGEFRSQFPIRIRGGFTFALSTSAPPKPQQNRALLHAPAALKSKPTIDWAPPVGGARTSPFWAIAKKSNDRSAVRARGSESKAGLLCS